jgi:histidinol phosphatase-like enzyme (inositol monophosphatase family)
MQELFSLFLHTFAHICYDILKGLMMSAIDFERFTKELAKASGEAILPFFRTSIGIENKAAKSPFDPVTEADRAGEAIMRAMIKRHFPAHGIIGEEYGAENALEEYVWVLDPIDGTKAFICGLPMWGTLIGLTHNGVPAYGMMNQPFTGEQWWGDVGSAHMSSSKGIKKLKTRRCASLEDAVLSTTSPLMFKGEDKVLYKKLEDKAKLARFGADCYAYAMLAAGHIDIVIETGLDPYDIVPLIPIIQGAGGIVTTWEGEDARRGGRILACGDKRLHEILLGMLG